MDHRIPNIINVVNHNDGLASASLNTVTKFFEQIKAVDDLQLQRREMFKMLMEKVPTQGKKGNYFDNGFTFFQDLCNQVGRGPKIDSVLFRRGYCFYLLTVECQTYVVATMNFDP